MDEPLTQEELATNAATWDHINLVMKLLASAQMELMRRQFTHDRSKLVPPEVSTFTEFTPKLKGSTYGSEEYKQFLEGMKPALAHHYSHNRHHPEFFPKSPEDARYKKIRDWITSSFDELSLSRKIKGAETQSALYADDLINVLENQSRSSVNNMNLFDLLEMLLDWYAATKRHDDGDIQKSLEINKERFGISDQLANILANTVPWIRDEFAELKTQGDLHDSTR
jgi:Family of unknown function (DUF5662)